MSEGPFRLRRRGNWTDIAAIGAERVLGLSALNRTHAAAARSDDFVAAALADLGVSVAASNCDVDLIPQQGPVLIVANHPFGAIDGLALLHVIRQRRPDVRLLANAFLDAIPELASHLLPIDVIGVDRATARNVASMRRSLRWLRDECGAIIVFPAGEVSAIQWRNWRAADRTWSPQVAGLARLSRATVVPVHVGGRNSWLFQFAGLVSPRLRTLLLAREAINKSGATVRLHIGTPIRPARLADFSRDDVAATNYLRARVELLGSRGSARAASRVEASHTPIIPEVDSSAVMRDLRAIPAGQTLGSSGEFRVVWASADQIPAALQEIGRLRETTFRAAGEGSGKSCDLDRFDDAYRHLICFHAGRREIVGAYRMGLSDELLSRGGVEQLYTSTLFRYGRELLKEMGPSIELGRSFVRAEYQREHYPLSLLWKGIATFVARHPHYRVLFGPVSVSGRYHSVTRELLIAFLQRSREPRLASLIAPRNPPQRQRGRAWASLSVNVATLTLGAVDDLVADLESDRQGMPVLLRQYMKLNAKLLGFNVDPEFSDVLDGLMMVDLPRANPALLARYMGQEAAAAYVARHVRN
jgi:putative hemolysin